MRPIKDLFVAQHPIITLTSDLGTSDYYVAAAKGSILRLMPDARIVDITHDSPKFDILHAAFNLQKAYKHFPEGSIHIVSINSIEDEYTRHIAFKADGHYFIGADNGIFSLIFQDSSIEVFTLNKDNPDVISVFPLLDVFVWVAIEISQGINLEKIGRKAQGLRRMLMPSATFNDDLLRGSIIYIDSYGNLISNIAREQFYNHTRGRNFLIDLRSHKYNLRKISKTYYDASEGEPLALFNQSGNLEIAIHQGSASKLLGLRINDSIRIEFE